MVVRDVLRCRPEMARLLSSCFGKLFGLPVRRCSYSSNMIHAMLARQMVTKKRYEAWPVFGGSLLRFSMVEFGCVTGLPCGEFEGDTLQTSSRHTRRKTTHIGTNCSMGGAI